MALSHSNETKDPPQKLQRLPDHARIQKRPLMRPAIPSPYAGADQTKVVYISSNTPFISAVKRVRKLLSLIDKRSMGKVNMINGQGTDKQRLQALGEKNAAGTEKEPEAVFLKATNRAIERALGLALFFQGQDDCQVKIKTGSAGVVDDIIEGEQPRPRKGKSAKQKNKGQKNLADREHEADDPPQEDEDTRDTLSKSEDELPETQVRKVSTIEVAIRLK